MSGVFFAGVGLGSGLFLNDRLYRGKGGYAMTVQRRLLWAATVLLGAIALGVVALSRGESVNAAWLVVAAVCVYVISYRFYGLFIATHVLQVDAARATPAVRHGDGLDYVSTNRVVLFGHHFAAIAGAGPLVGPVLAAQMGYLPGTLWILAGVVFAGAVQDMTVLFLSTRRDGRSLGDMIRSEMGPVPGGIALIEDSWVKHGGMDDRVELHGTGGVIYCDLLHGSSMETFSLDGYGYAVEKAGETKGWTFTVFEEAHIYGFPHEMRHFTQCVLNDQAPRETGEDGVATLEIIYAAYESAGTGRRIVWPYKPKKSGEVPVNLWLKA
ncbi:MAG: hypothetical protein LAP13_21805 [Acidobacteriia bacterium]|nr:hypothetical protein [Terriglobia bacterium]